MKNLLIAVMMILITSAANGDVQIFSPSNDTAVWYRTGNEAYNSAVTGSDIDMDVYCHETLIGAYCYIQFDLSELETNAVLTSASLQVTKMSTNPVQDFAGTHSDTAAVMVDSRTAFYGLNNVAGNTPQDWNENSLSFNTIGSELTSGSATGTDPFNSVAGRATNLNGLESIFGGTNLTLSGAALNTFLQSRMDDTGLVTFMIDFETIESGRGFAFNTKESGLTGVMPILTLNYSTNGVPTDPLAVTLIDTVTTATLANGIVSAVINKSNGQLSDLRKADGPNLLANGGRVYFDANGTVTDGSSGYHSFAPTSWVVVTNTPQQIEVALTQSSFMGFDVELHYVLRAGQSGVDAFTVWHHGTGDPEVSLGQSRIVARCDPNLFTMAYAGPEKTGQMIEPSVIAASEMIMDATYKLPMTSSYTNETGRTHDGYPVYTKYDWSQYMEDHRVHGIAGDVYGVWTVQGSTEYCNGGPTKAYQTVHGGDTPLSLWLFQSTHKGAAPINVQTNEVWTKLFGPYQIYINNGTNAASLWNDAQHKADLEAAAWPPDWMDNDAFPIARGTVNGRLHMLGQSCSNALMVLSGPGEYWHTVEAKACQFWARAEADGSFSIPNVRPGTYSLYAEVPGVVGIMERSNITVTSNTTHELGTLEWEPARYEQRLFRLGTPDLSAAEFRFGSAMRQYGLWWRYQEEQGTNDLNFAVGTSDPATDWYYAMTMLPVELTPTNGIWVSPKWNIHFEVNAIPPAPARLSIDMAGSMTGAFYVFVNGINICPNPTAGIYVVNDSGIYRSATEHSSLQRYELTFDPALLQEGSNTISFTLRGTSSSANPWSEKKPVRPAAGIMFDCIQLEAGDLITNSVPRFQALENTETGLLMQGNGGFPEAEYHLSKKNDLSQTNWIRMQTGAFNQAGRFAVSNQTESQSAFYRIEID